jgi:hypothetical protein
VVFSNQPFNEKWASVRIGIQGFRYHIIVLSRWCQAKASKLLFPILPRKVDSCKAVFLIHDHMTAAPSRDRDEKKSDNFCMPRPGDKTGLHFKLLDNPA